MKRIHISSRAKWRSWLAENHDKEEQGIWLVFFKKGTQKASLEYDEAVGEALCFGWIDSVVRRIDDEKYCRKFTPRRPGSVWSDLNKRRVASLIREDRMTEFGLAKIEEAKRRGRWEINPRPEIPSTIPKAFAEALKRNRSAREFFERLAPTYRKQYIGWIVGAKRLETQRNRTRDAVKRLAEGQKLGIK
jgi:uncharacterized protein YdeI (YjbR/CyaY-like superfamily)